MNRFRDGGAPRLLELCSGCGGLSLGFKAAGFELTAHLESDPEAAASYAMNFGPDKDVGDPWSVSRDMESCSAAQLVSDLGLPTSVKQSFDVLAAGLPCQAFARIGRSKLRSISGAEDAFRKDPRAVLYRRFLQFVTDTQPLAILLENVPDILNFGGHNVPEEICDALEEAGYTARYTLLNAAYYGVPQIRERLFLIAFANELGAQPRFPVPKRFLDLPRGYEGSRHVALKHVDRLSGRFHEICLPSPDLPAAATVREALEDLPVITEHLNSAQTIRRRKLSEVLPYRRSKNELSEYASLMRGWPSFSSEVGASGHLVRLTPRDFPIFAKMKRGTDYPRALRVAEQLFREAVVSKDLSGLSPRSSAYRSLKAEMVPPYDPKKFPNKWWKLLPSMPSRTLTAHMGKDTYSHIHYDGRQARTVSVREAARLQSFPDGFNFAGAMNAAFRQIGNAVPPLLGFALASTLKRQIVNASCGRKQDSRRRAA